jgi:hypothetical protein
MQSGQLGDFQLGAIQHAGVGRFAIAVADSILLADVAGQQHAFVRAVADSILLAEGVRIQASIGRCADAISVADLPRTTATPGRCADTVLLSDSVVAAAFGGVRPPPGHLTVAASVTVATVSASVGCGTVAATLSSGTKAAFVRADTLVLV